MRSRKSLFITFEGIEGSGKSYQSKKLFNLIKKKKIPVILTREPGGTPSAEKIRNLILKDYFHKDFKEKFNKYTDTLLYLAARNEHVQNKIKPALNNKKVVMCDRFIDSTMAYQVYGKGIKKNFIELIHKFILDGIQPDFTFVLKVKIPRLIERLSKRKNKNRYDKFSKNFYLEAQNAFIKIANKNKSKYLILDNSTDSKEVENEISSKFAELMSK